MKQPHHSRVIHTALPRGKWAEVNPGAHFAGNLEQVTKATTPQRDSVKSLCGGSQFKEGAWHEYQNATS
jgi:hypothetical protein